MLKEKDTHIEKTGPKEIAWFIGLWGLGFTTILIVGGLLKLILKT